MSADATTRCRKVRLSRVCSPRTATWAPSTSGSTVPAAAVPSCTGGRCRRPYQASTLSHGPGRAAVGAAVMPWPSMPSRSQIVARYPGTGLSGDSASAASSAAITSPRPAACRLASPGAPGRAGQDLLGRVLEQLLTGRAVLGLYGHVGRGRPDGQVDPQPGRAGAGRQLEPAGLGRRGRVDRQLALPPGGVSAALDADPIGGAPVIGRGDVRERPQTREVPGTAATRADRGDGQRLAPAPR